jgi:hypothetical protein
MSFRNFLESKDIFGFEIQHAEPSGDDMLEKPIHQFDLELMMDLLSRKRIGVHEAHCPFMNEIKWGTQPGAIKLEVDTGYTFYIKKLGIDKQGGPRWVTKKMYQLNRQGHGGVEDIVAQEIYEQISRVAGGTIDGPQEGYSSDELEKLVFHLNGKIKRVMKNVFIPVGIKKLGEYAYVIAMEVRGHGLETQDQKRIEQNHTNITYDPDQGTIRIFNCNIESKVGGPHSWGIMESDLDLYFFPSQSRDEISDCLAIHFKYY